jgi:hypothetical protein
VINLERGCKYQGKMRRRHQLKAASEFKCRQCALYEMLTVSLALFGDVHNVLREGVPSTLGMAINPEGGSISLDHLPSIVQRANQNGNGLGVERSGMVHEILAQFASPSLRREHDRSLSHRRPLPMMIVLPLSGEYG